MGALTFRILGPLEIERDGTPLQLRGPRMRALLGMLLLRENEVVSTERLIDAVWGETPPPTARTALQGLVSKLRRILEEDGSVVLDTRGSAYVLRVDPDRFDLRRFERLSEEGRRALAAAEPERARETLDEALRMWRGRPLQDVELPGLSNAELASLEERHTTVLEAQIEAELALGHHLEIVLEIDGHLDEHPFNERLHGLAMLALYRAGRQAEALEVGARLRRRLSEELGLEPTPAARKLEQQILNQDAALELPEAGVPPPPAAERRKTVTVLVCRISPSAETAQSGDLETRRQALVPFVRRAEEVVTAHGGTVHENLAGRLVTVFGLPEAHEHDAVRALVSAEELRKVLSDIELLVPHELRIGVATGEVIVEEAEAGQSLLSADPFDLANHLARSARPGEILFNQTALRLAEGATQAEPLELLVLDDGGQPVAAYRLDAVSTVAPARMRSPLVGRVGELSVLRETFERVARERLCSLITILGPAGIGKSRLIREFVDELGGHADVLAGRCLPYGSDITFWPIAEMVKQAAAIHEGDPPDSVRRGIRSLVVSGDDEEFLLRQVAAILGVEDERPVPDEVFWAIRKLLEGLARDRPLVAVFEDIHWAESTLLDLIEHVAGWSRGVPLMVLCAARPDLLESRTSWGGGRLDAANIRLGPLSKEEASELAGNILKGGDLAEAARELILDAAEGHPLFLEELLAVLIDDGLLLWEDGRWVLAGDLAEVPIPLTVQALVAARLDRLSGWERIVLERAAVVGKEFSEEDLLALAEAEEAELPTGILDQLAGKDLVVQTERSRAGARTCRFRHILIRDVAYEATAKAARASYHERFADVLEARVAERLPEYEEIVAYHLESAHRYREELGLAAWERTELRTRAATHLVSAGRRSFARGDMSAAASLLNRGLVLLDDSSVVVPEVAWHLGVALFEIGELARADEVLRGGLSAAESRGDQAWGWRLRLELADLGHWRAPDAADMQVVGRIAEEAVAAFQRIGDSAGAARAHRLLGDARVRLGRYEEAMEAFETGQRLAFEAGDEREASQRPSFGVVHGPIAAERCLEIIRRGQARVPRRDPDGLAGLGLVLAMLGRLHEARRVFEEGLARSSDLGSEWKAANVNMHRGAAMLMHDERAEAEASLRPAVEALQRMGERSMMSTAIALLGEALYRQGKNDEAMLATLASEEATAEDDLASQMAWRGVRAKVLAARGNHREAERLAREAVSYAEKTDLVNMAADARMALAVVLAACGKEEEASEQLRQARAMFEAKGNLASAKRASVVGGRARAEAERV